jgi:hypothetical protein
LDAPITILYIAIAIAIATTILKTRGVSHCGLACPFTLKSVLWQKKKNYGNSNIAKIIIFE